MSARLSFLRRTAEETQTQGGEVFFDINGKNVGKLAPVDCFVDVPAGTYTIKMYKSHSYGSLIGFAETTVTLKDGDDLMVRYFAPAMVNQPGNIVISDYSQAAADQLTRDTSAQISARVREEKELAEKSNRSTRRWVTWLIIGGVVTGILWAIVYLIIWGDFLF